MMGFYLKKFDIFVYENYLNSNGKMIVVAVHAGVGHFADDAERICAEVLRKHCKRPMEVNTTNVVKQKANEQSHLVGAIMELERCGKINCGCGANLTDTGTVELEAAYMSSEELAYGAVAVVSNCVHPIYAAKQIADASTKGASANFGLINPMILAGEGASQFCTSLNVGIVPNNDALKSKAACNEWKRAKKFMLSDQEHGGGEEAKKARIDDIVVGDRMDTVGGIAINMDGDCEACVSSGGLLLKKEGRIGHSAQFGAAIWAEKCGGGGLSVAVSLSGCGEALIRTHLAESMAQYLLSINVLDELALVQHVKQFLDDHFLRSSRLALFSRDRVLAGGLIAIHQHRSRPAGEDASVKNEEDESDPKALLIVFHNTDHFPFAFLSGADQKIRRLKSQNSKIGEFVCSLFPI